MPESGRARVHFSTPSPPPELPGLQQASPVAAVVEPVVATVGGFMASCVPVNWIMGKELDELTQKGVAVVFLMIVCIVGIALLLFYGCRTRRRNRAGYRGTLRQVTMGAFSCSKKLE